jgi:hypothetical protein
MSPYIKQLQANQSCVAEIREAVRRTVRILTPRLLLVDRHLALLLA